LVIPAAKSDSPWVNCCWATSFILGGGREGGREGGRNGEWLFEIWGRGGGGGGEGGGGGGGGGGFLGLGGGGGGGRGGSLPSLVHLALDVMV